MTDPLINPHDKFFRESFSYPQTAHDFLRDYLPQQLSQHFDLSTLNISKESFIDPDLQEYQSDVLYELTLNTSETLNIYILFEHKSGPDKWVPLQLLGYLTRIWQKHPKKGRTYLQPILPLVVYHGEGEWRINQEFRGMFSEKLPPVFQPYLPNFRYWLLDLGNYPDENIKGWAILQACFRLLKYVRSQEFGAQFEQSIRLLMELPHQQTALQYVETMLRYATSAATETSEKDIRTIVQGLVDEGDKLMSTIAENWFEQGIKKGVYQGQLDSLIRTLHRLFGELPPDLPDKLEQLSLAQLQQAFDVAFDVPGLTKFEKVITNWLSGNS